jgi:N4-(beta-N-acetylglucosaminyl)-L-asparaginase
MLVLANIEAASGIPTSADMLKNNENILDALVAGISKVEEDPTVRSVGYGGWPNMLGDMQFDAGIMDGNSLEIGAVGAVPNILHVCQLAQQVLKRLPHNIIVGEGARRFADEVGFKVVDMLCEDSAKVWRDKLVEVLSPSDFEKFPNLPLAPLSNIITDPERVRDTTVFLGIDAQSNIGVATSTSGWAWKYPGRLGDSPIAGAGFYADSRYGAAACTHTGEMTMRTCTSFSVVDGLRRGLSLQQAVEDAASQLLELKGGFIGEVVIHAIDKNGDHLVVNVLGTKALKYWVWDDKMPKPTTGLSTQF